MEETLDLSSKKLINKLGYKEELLDTLQKGMDHSFDATSSNVLLTSHH